MNPVERYISECDPALQPRLIKLREVILNAAPGATEAFSWQMPTFQLHGNLVHFFVHKGHIGLYPGPSGVEHFLPKLGKYKTSKGGIQLPLTEPIPYELIEEIVRFRAAENQADFAQKQARKRARK